MEMANKSYMLIITIIAFCLLITLPDVLAVPHTVYGYAYYKDGKVKPATNASVTVWNINKNEILKNITCIDNKGFYYFDVGSPGPNWSDGDIINIIIEKYMGNQTWKGNATLKLDFGRPNQRMQDIYLSPQNLRKRTPDFKILSLLISFFIILISKKFK